MKYCGKMIVAFITALSLLLMSPAVSFAENGGAAACLKTESQDAVTASAASSLIRIRDTVFDINEAAESWQNGSGWKNDTENHYIKFVDYDGSDTSLITGDVEVTLAMTGLNRLGTISAGDNVNIIGTGILLVDSIEMAEGAVLDLQPNTNIYTSGSVAVFLKQADGSYMLINRSEVPGLLDEEYTLPENTALTIPAGVSLDLCSIIVKTEEYYNDAGEYALEIKYYVSDSEDISFDSEHGGAVSFCVTSAQLTVPASSSLTIAQDASVNMHKMMLYGKTYSAKLNMEGALTLYGSLNQGVVSIPGGTLSGSGTISCSEIYLNVTSGTSEQINYSSDVLHITGVSSGEKVNPVLNSTTLVTEGENFDLGDVAVSGQSIIAYGNNTSTDNITVSSDGRLDLCAASELTGNAAMMINGTVSGGTVNFAGGVFFLGNNSAVTSASGITSGTDYYDAVIFDGSGTLPSSDFPAVVSASRAAELLGASSETIRTSYASVMQENPMFLGYTYSITEGIAGTLESGVSRDESGQILAEDVIAAAGYEEAKKPYYFVEVLRLDDTGVLSSTVYSYDEMIGLDNVFLLRVLIVFKQGTGTGGSTMTSTNTQFTGTGVLGNDTGSVSGGTAVTVYQGTGRKNPDFIVNSNDTEPESDDNDSEDNNSNTEDNNKNAADNTGNKEENNNSPSENTGNTEENNNSPSENSESIEQNNNSEENSSVPAQESSSGDNNSAENSSDTAGNNNSTAGDTGSSGASQGGSSPARRSSNTENDSAGPSGESGSQSASDPAGNVIKTVVTKENDGSYKLCVYIDGTEVDSLDGSSVTAQFRYPEGKAENSYYAVFDNDGQKVWLPALYDADKKTLSFKTDRVGVFKVAEVSVKDAVFECTGTKTPVYRELSIKTGDEEITELADPLNISVLTTDGEETEKDLYAVFVDEDENLSIFPAVYDENSGQYSFYTDAAGNFVIIQLTEAYDPESDELYEACMDSDEVRILITIMRLYAFWS